MSHSGPEKGSALRRLLLSRQRMQICVLSVVLALLPILPAHAGLSGSVAATGWRQGAPVISPPTPFRIGLAPAAPGLSLSIHPLSPAFSTAGETIGFAVTLRNDGNVTLRDPVIDADAPVISVDCPQASDLAPGASLTCNAVARVRPEDLAAASLPVSATALAIDAKGGMVGPAEASLSLPATEADLVLAAEFRPERTDEGQTAEFLLRLENRGPADASGVEVAIDLPQELTYRSHAGDGFDQHEGTWRVESLPAGSSTKLSVQVGVAPSTAGKVFSGEARIIRMDQIDGKDDGNRNRAELKIAAADLVTRRAIEAGESSRPGARVRLITQIRNDGPDPARQVSIDVAVPEGLEVLEAIENKGSFDAASGEWRIDELAPGEQADLRVAATVSLAASGRTLTFAGPAAASAITGDARTDGDELTAALQVDLPRLAAHDDSAAGIDGVAGSAGILNVLANDEADGVPIDPATQVVAALTRQTPLTLDPGGNLGLPAGTQAGSYRLDYRTCFIALPQACATATALVEVAAPALAAHDDEPPDAADGTSGAARFLDLLANDRRGSAAVRADEIRLEILSQAPGEYLQIDDDGWLSVPAGTPAGLYTLDYRICDRINPDNCSSARTRIAVDAPASIAGTIYRDMDGSGDFEPFRDQGEANLEVELLSASEVVARTVTGPDGAYRLASLPAATGYRMLVRRQDGRLAASLAGLDLLPGQTLTGIDAATNPTGIIYDSIYRRPVAGARVTFTDGNGALLPDDCLADPQMQGQVTERDGAYRLELLPGAHPACPAGHALYRIAVVPPQGYAPFPSALLPPLPEEVELARCPFDAVPGGRCQLAAHSGAPLVGDPTTYALAFLAEAGEPLPIYNHVPLDPLPRTEGMNLTVSADRQEIARGGQTGLEIRLQNATPVSQQGMTLINVPPPGFLALDASALIGGDERKASDPLIFRELALAPDASLTLRLSLEAEKALIPGRYIHRVRLLDADGQPLAGEVALPIEVLAEEATTCSDIVGRVFLDADRDGVSGSEETGLAGVRIEIAGGPGTLTDDLGHYRFSCTQIPGGKPGMGVRLFLDLDTLPSETILEDGNQHQVELTERKAAVADFPALSLRIVRLDMSGGAFEGETDELSPRWQQGLEDLIGLLRAEPSILRLTYRSAADDAGLAERRLAAVASLIQERWQENETPYPLEIREEILD